ncbi:chaplin [Streptomyces litmocidini]|uniref:chaplin n=1 Tax=Streptomyces litmocidini TaxID=67318 RepID=UPI0036F99C82
MKCKKAAAVVAGIIMAMGAASPAFADSEAQGAAFGSPGLLSGNVVQAPIHAPINICGNSVNLVGLVNPAFGNVCVNA